MPGLARRFALVYVLLAVALGGGAYVGWTSTAARAAPSCAGPAGGEDPIATALAFLEQVVERTNPAGGYRFVTAAARRGISCRSWTHGRIPFEEYRHIDWKRAAYRRVAAGTGQIVLRVTLSSTDRREQPGAFLLELREDGVLWQVGFWGRAGGASPGRAFEAT